MCSCDQCLLTRKTLYSLLIGSVTYSLNGVISSNDCLVHADSLNVGVDVEGRTAWTGVYLQGQLWYSVA